MNDLASQRYVIPWDGKARCSSVYRLFLSAWSRRKGGKGYLSVFPKTARISKNRLAVPIIVLQHEHDMYRCTLYGFAFTRLTPGCGWRGGAMRMLYRVWHHRDHMLTEPLQHCSVLQLDPCDVQCHHIPFQHLVVHVRALPSTPSPQ